MEITYHIQLSSRQKTTLTCTVLDVCFLNFLIGNQEKDAEQLSFTCFLRFLQTAGDEEDEVLSNSCSNKLGSKTQPQMAAVPQAKSKPYHWLCLGTWRRQHLTLEKSTYQYLIMILLFYVLSIWWNIMEVIWNLFFYIFLRFFDIVVYIIVWSDSCIWCVLWTHWVCLVLFHCLIELDDGKIYRKPLYLMVKTMVSCRFSLKPIHWLSPLMLQCSPRGSPATGPKSPERIGWTAESAAKASVRRRAMQRP